VEKLFYINLRQKNIEIENVFPVPHPTSSRKILSFIATSEIKLDIFFPFFSSELTSPFNSGNSWMIQCLSLKKFLEFFYITR
jgi:hypothetical protein